MMTWFKRHIQSIYNCTHTSQCLPNQLETNFILETFVSTDQSILQLPVPAWHHWPNDAAILLFFKPTGTKPQPRKLKLNNVNSCDNVSCMWCSLCSGRRPHSPFGELWTGVGTGMSFPCCPLSQLKSACQSLGSILWPCHAMYQLFQ